VDMSLVICSDLELEERVAKRFKHDKRKLH